MLFGLDVLVLPARCGSKLGIVLASYWLKLANRQNRNNRQSLCNYVVFFNELGILAQAKTLSNPVFSWLSFPIRYEPKHVVKITHPLTDLDRAEPNSVLRLCELRWKVRRSY